MLDRLPEERIRVMRIIARLNIGGPAVHVSLLTAGLQDSVFESTLVSGSLGEGEGDMSYLAHELGINPIVIHDLQREISLPGDAKTLFKLVKLMRKLRPHIVHTHTAKAGFIGRLAAKLTGVPIIIHTFHGHVFDGYFGPLKTQIFILLEKWAAAASDRILTISDGLRDALVDYGIAPAEKIDVIPLGLKLDQLTQISNLRGQLRSELGISTESRLVGIIGRLVPIKNHELFLAAAKLVRQQREDVHFVIVGDGERRAELETACREMHLVDVVHFTGWRRDLPVIYADLDTVVISSLNEGTPVSIIEAMAAGVPVVATHVGGIPDLLDGGKLGEMVPSDDVEKLASAIVNILDQPEDSQSESAAQRTALHNYGAEHLIKNIRHLYMRLLQEKSISGIRSTV